MTKKKKREENTWSHQNQRLHRFSPNFHRRLRKANIEAITVRNLTFHESNSVIQVGDQ